MHFSVKKEAYDRIERQFRCSHPTRELRRRGISDGRTAFYRQCVKCGHAGRAVSKRDAASELRSTGQAPAFDARLEVTWRARKSAEYVKTRSEIRPALDVEYQAYLRSEKWALIRSQALARSSGLCQICDYSRAAEVHHITYARLGHEHPDDLMAVCGDCHDLLHGGATNCDGVQAG